MKSKLGSRQGYKLGCSAEAFEVDNSACNPLDAEFFVCFFSLKKMSEVLWNELTQNAPQTVYSIHTAVKLNSPTKPIFES